MVFLRLFLKKSKKNLGVEHVLFTCVRNFTPKNHTFEVTTLSRRCPQVMPRVNSRKIDLNLSSLAFTTKVPATRHDTLKCAMGFVGSYYIKSVWRLPTDKIRTYYSVHNLLASPQRKKERTYRWPLAATSVPDGTRIVALI
jgi:hypothetical protein